MLDQMTDNVVSLKKDQPKLVPVYTPVRDPTGGWRLELIEWIDRAEL